MISRTLALATIATILSFQYASAQEQVVDPQAACDAMGDAFDNYSAKLADPDQQMAADLAHEGQKDCESGKTDEGMDKISQAMGAMHDGKASKK
jgi:hypothetical protein